MGEIYVNLLMLLKITGREGGSLKQRENILAADLLKNDLILEGK